jgi:hypothetical protein
VQNDAYSLVTSLNNGFAFHNAYPRGGLSLHQDLHQKYLFSGKARLQPRMPFFADDQWGIV